VAWYAAHTHVGAEAQALRHLERQGFSTYLPRYRKRRRHARRTDWVQAPLFPRYLFVWMDVARERWQAIQSTIGIHYLICSDGKPLPVADQILEELKLREDEGGLINMAAQNPFRRGEKVRVLEGVLLDKIGLFQCSSDKERAIVLLRLLGRDLRVTLPQAALCKT